MKTTVFLLPAVLVGCASLGRSDEPTPDEIFARAQATLEQRDYTSAYDQLSRFYQTHWSLPVGEKALLSMAAIELDPRNPGRRLDAGAVLAGQHLSLPSASAWNKPVGQALYHLALEVAESKDRITLLEYELAAAQRERDAALALARREAAAARSAREEAAEARAEALRAETRAAAQTPRTIVREVKRAAPSQAPAGEGGEAALRRERDRLAAELESARARLAERDAELERIRETLTPPTN